MKMVKSLLLASVAGLAATAGAQAADLPVKAKPVEYVKICSLYGAGFFYLPGTETCLKIGGYASYEAVFGTAGASHVQRLNGDIALGTRAQDRFTQRGRLNLSFDTRTQTEYGTLRTYTLLDVFQNTSNADYNTPLTNNSHGTIAAYVFMQLAGFTLGKAIQLTRPDFAPVWSTAYLFGAGDLGSGTVGTLQAAYTAEFGNGAKLTVGIEDSTYGRNPIYDTTAASVGPFATAWTANTYGGQSWPDFVANFQINQAWGGFMLVGVARNVNATYYNTAFNGTLVETNGGPTNKLGWGVVGALEIKNLPTGAGDKFQVFGGLGEGIGHLFHSVTPGQSVFGVTGASTNGSYQSLAYGPVLDAVYSAPGGATAGNLELTRFYGAQVGYEHYWIPAKLRSSVFGGMELIRFSDAAKAALCTSMVRANNAGGQGLTGSNCNFDINLLQAGTRTVWTVVPGFDLYFEGLYTRLDTKLDGQLNPAAANLKPGTAQGVNYQLKPQDIFSAEFRAIRAF